MKKFLNLLQKEIRELITVQLLISLLFTIFLFYFIGQMLKTEMKKAMKVQEIAVLNLDDSAISQDLLGTLKSANFEPKPVPEADKEKAIAWTKGTDINLLLVIPRGFGESVERLESKEIETYSFLRTFSMVGSRSSVIINAVIKALNEFISNDYLKKKIPDISPQALKNLITSGLMGCPPV